MASSIKIQFIFVNGRAHVQSSRKESSMRENQSPNKLGHVSLYIYKQQWLVWDGMVS
jgi:hypothetical protein